MITVLGASPLDTLVQAQKAATYALQKQAAATAVPAAPPAPTALPPAQQAEHDRLKAIWTATTDPAAKAAAWQALVAYDASLPPPPPPPAPAIKTTQSDFLAEHKTSLLIGGGLLAAAGVGYVLYRRRKGR